MQNNIIDRSLFNFIYYSVCLIPFALITGPFLPDFLVSLSAIAFVIITVRNKNYYYYKSVFFYFFLLFYIYLVLNSIFSNHTIFSLESSSVYIRFGLFSLAIWYLIDSDQKFIKFFFIGLIFALIVGIFDGYLQYFNGKNTFGYIYNNRLNLLTSDQLLLGNYLARIFPLFLALAILLMGSKKLYYVFIFILLVTIDVLVYISGERTALGLMLLSNVFIILFMKNLRLFRISSIIISIILISIISIVSPQIKERNIDATLTQLGLNNENSSINFFSNKHESHIIPALRMFESKPLIGYGPNTFRIYCSDQRFEVNDYSCTTHPHHTVSQLLGETGIFGTFFFLLAAIYFIKAIFNHMLELYRREYTSLSDYQICLLACFFCTLWPILPTLNFFNNWISIVYFLPIGFYLQSIHSSKNNINLN